MKLLLWLVAVGVASVLPAQQPAAARMESVTSRAYLDTTVNACTDFAQYANGGWLRRNPIPPTEVSWGIQNVNYRSVASTLDSILMHAARTFPSARDHATRTLGIHYSSCMDSSAIERLGWRPIAAQLRRIESLRTRKDVESEIARLQRQYVLVPFVLLAASDPGDAQVLIARLARARLPLPDRGYYLRRDSASAEVRERYVRHIATLMGLIGRDSAEASAEALHALSLETALAEAAYTAVERRDPLLIHNKMSVAQLQQLMPGFAWPQFFREMGRPDISVVDVENPKQMRAVDALLAARPVKEWRAYLTWVVVRSAAPNLGSAFESESARFARQLYGATAPVPRAKRCADGIYLPQLLDQKFLEARFSARALAIAADVGTNVTEAFRARLQHLAWMGDATKEQALAKLAAATIEIGFPSKWIDLSALRLRPGQFYANSVASLRALHAGDMSRIGQSDAGTWPIQASDGDKYNWNNRILLPAGGLQPPLFDPSGDDAANYGALGAVIGHELIHSFDEHGAAFDASNNLRNWWTPVDLANFRQRTALLVRQFNGYTVLDSLHVNGKLTLNENIADYGGVSIAYDAFKNATRARDPALKDGFTPEQRFFVAYARNWAGGIRPEAQRLNIQTSLHAPRQWRINGPLSNMPEFAAAFSCKPGDAMVRPDSLRPLIW